MLVFESEDFLYNIQKDFFPELKKIIKKELNISRIYKTYMVRCRAKHCVIRNNLSIRLDEKLIRLDNTCKLNNDVCTMAQVNSNTNEIISCLNYVISINCLRFCKDSRN